MVENTCPGGTTTTQNPSRNPTELVSLITLVQQLILWVSDLHTCQSTQNPITSAPSAQSPSKGPVTLSSEYPTASPSVSNTYQDPVNIKDLKLIESNIIHILQASPTKLRWYPDRHPNYSEGRCITTLPVPQFRDTYETLRKCCESAYAGQSSGACLSEEETETSSTDTTSTSSTTTIIQFYSNPSNGMCAIVDETVPSWIPASDYYTDWKECCLAGWVFDNCMAANPLSTEEETLVEDEQETTSTTTSSTTTVLQFYFNPSNGLCAIVDESTPSWIITRYTDWAECCKAGWVFDKCMAENPFRTGEETLVELEEETTTTTSSSNTLQLYSNPSNGVCGKVDSSTPSWITTFYTDWTECCRAGWVFEKCMEASSM